MTDKPKLSVDVSLGSPISFAPPSPASSVSSTGLSSPPANFSTITSFPTPIASRVPGFAGNEIEVTKTRSPPKPLLPYSHDVELKERIISEYKPPVRTRLLLSREKRIVSTPVETDDVDPEPRKKSPDVKVSETYYLNGTPYVFKEQLGWGNFSRVVSAQHENDVVAVKILIQPNDDPNFQYYVNREVLVLRALNHRLIVKLFGTSTGLSRSRSLQEHGLGPDTRGMKEYHLFVTYCPGGNLLDFASKNAASNQHNVRYWVAIRRMVVEMCEAIAYMHSQLVVHRDLKLENILLMQSLEEILLGQTPGPLLKIGDFGMSKQLTVAGELMSTRCGSTDYVAQEILMGLEYDGRLTDAWSLGVIIYSLLEDRLPFDCPPENYAPKGMSPLVMRRRRAKHNTAHRIAMIDWEWYKEELGVVKEDIGRIVHELRTIVENLLVRKDRRKTCAEILQEMTKG